MSEEEKVGEFVAKSSYHQKYYRENYEKLSAYNKSYQQDYYKNNKAKFKAYYEKNKTQRQEYQSNYQHKSVEGMQNYQHKYYIKRKLELAKNPKWKTDSIKFEKKEIVISFD